MIITTKVLPLFVSGQSWVADPWVHMFSEHNFDNSAIFVSCQCCRKKPKTAVGSFSNWKLSFVLSPTFEVSQRFYIKKKYIYRKVASSRLSRLVAHLAIFRLFMKGKFDAYVLWPLAKRVQNWIVDRSTTRDFTVVHCTEVRCSSFPSGRFTITTVSVQFVHCISEWTKRKTGKFYLCAMGWRNIVLSFLQGISHWRVQS